MHDSYAPQFCAQWSRGAQVQLDASLEFLGSVEQWPPRYPGIPSNCDSVGFLGTGGL